VDACLHTATLRRGKIMSEAEREHHGKGIHEVVDSLRQEFADELAETMLSFDVSLDAARNGHQDLGKVITDCRRAVMRFRGQAANFGMHRLATVAHRLDEYLVTVPVDLPPPRMWGDLQGYFDLMIRLAEGKADGEANTAGLVRSLPTKLGFELTDIEVRDVEVLLVMPHGAQTRFVERELQQCGYRVSIISDTLLAFALVVESKPDLVIISAMMPGLDGIDLAVALASMPATRNIPLAVITSLDKDDDSLSLLPQRVPILFKGESFADDLFKALDNLFLI
jgi:CheY-like chemotaxis protein